jgi:hypothetical protein
MILHCILRHNLLDLTCYDLYSIFLWISLLKKTLPLSLSLRSKRHVCRNEWHYLQCYTDSVIQYIFINNFWTKYAHHPKHATKKSLKF